MSGGLAYGLAPVPFGAMMTLESVKCRECGEPMTCTRRKRYNTGTYQTEDRHTQHFTIELGTWNCPNCGTAMQEGRTRGDDIWLSGIFRIPTKRRG